MTAVTQIIQDALRETNLIPLGVSPTTDQQTEAFRLLSSLVASMLGNEAGENLNPFPLGGDGIEAPRGYPWWNNELPPDMYVPTNSRLMLNLTDEGQVYFDPAPHDGARMGIVDCANNLDICPLTIHGNGRKIDAQFDLVVDTPGTTQEWVYREDIGSWVTVIPLALDGQMPWPSEFDDLFVISLAMRLNPRYGQVLHPASVDTLRDLKVKFSARYGQSNIMKPSEIGLLYLTNANVRNIYRQYGNPNDMFNAGWPY